MLILKYIYSLFGCGNMTCQQQCTYCITNNASVECISVFTYEACEDEEAVCALYVLNSCRLWGHRSAVLNQTPFELEYRHGAVFKSSTGRFVRKNRLQNLKFDLNECIM